MSVRIIESSKFIKPDVNKQEQSKNDFCYRRTRFPLPPRPKTIAVTRTDKIAPAVTLYGVTPGHTFSAGVANQMTGMLNKFKGIHFK